MPLIGLHRETRERINILTLANPRDELAKGDVLCPLSVSYTHLTLPTIYSV